MSPYLRFLAENRQSVVPPADITNTNTYLLRELAARWRIAGEDVKKRLERIYENDQVCIQGVSN